MIFQATGLGPFSFVDLRISRPLFEIGVVFLVCGRPVRVSQFELSSLVVFVCVHHLTHDDDWAIQKRMPQPGEPQSLNNKRRDMSAKRCAPFRVSALSSIPPIAETVEAGLLLLLEE